MVNGSAPIGVRASTWSSVFIVGAGGPGGFRLPADASPKMMRQATIPIAAALRSTLLTFIADPPCVRCPAHLDADWMWGCRYPYTPGATRDQLRLLRFAGCRTRTDMGWIRRLIPTRVCAKEARVHECCTSTSSSQSRSARLPDVRA